MTFLQLTDHRPGPSARNRADGGITSDTLLPPRNRAWPICRLRNVLLLFHFDGRIRCHEILSGAGWPHGADVRLPQTSRLEGETCCGPIRSVSLVVAMAEADGST